MKAFNQNSANVSLGKGQSEGTQLVTQLQRLFKAFYEDPDNL